MIADFALIILLLVVVKKVLKTIDNGKVFLQTALIYAIVVSLLRLSGARGYDLITMVKSREDYHDAEVKKLFNKLK